MLNVFAYYFESKHVFQAAVGSPKFLLSSLEASAQYLGMEGSIINVMTIIHNSSLVFRFLTHIIFSFFFYYRLLHNRTCQMHAHPEEQALH